MTGGKKEGKKVGSRQRQLPFAVALSLFIPCNFWLGQPVAMGGGQDRKEKNHFGYSRPPHCAPLCASLSHQPLYSAGKRQCPEMQRAKEGKEGKTSDAGEETPAPGPTSRDSAGCPPPSMVAPLVG